MNLKEAFRYQNFLEAMLNAALGSIRDSSHALHLTRRHLRSKVNPEAEDLTETVVPEQPFASNDDVIRFLKWLVKTREALSVAINRAKATTRIDLDAAVEANKFRQRAAKSIRSMLDYNKAYVRKETGRDYRFNVAGDQTAYTYEIETTATEAFDRDEAKRVLRDLASRSDEASTEIDAAMINTQVAFTPLFDVNESFDDVMSAFIDMGLTGE